ncbi:Mov34/MPN/PAD-1 family protein [Azoarcus sp. KH32C]|uniref:Mov34/MPN/PAD-1 family protein n=1 Tax=Azoarcus sp. KH32C TaxID=748247 RepID=UPI000238602A|nr:M67 family metallopeptidase [Azoarcus sp. KH32C]BAL25076.1 hypothetical protein AZKH_2770 [Azoarcus sp. KH32C]
MAALHLPARLRDRILTLAQKGYPEEVCGLLLGRQEADTVAVCDLHETRNVHPDRTADRFLIEPQDYLGAERAAVERGLQVVGVWHSHPDHPACPSATDLEFAWPGWSYPIVSVNSGVATELRSWRLDGEVFSEEEMFP